LTLLLALPAPPACADEEDAGSARDAFFEGIDLQQAGDCEGAVARYELALGADPNLHQARLYLAECFHALGMDGRAVEQLEIYMAHPFPGADPDRAAALLVECGGELPTTGEQDAAEVDPVVDPPPRAASPADWRPVRLELGPGVSHFANEIGLVAVGPLLEVRVLAWRYLEVGARGGVGFGKHPLGQTAIRVPELAVGVAGSFPVGPIRLTAGAHVPVVFSELPAGTRADAGVRGEVGVRWAPGGGAVVVAAQFEGGYLVAPSVGGSVRVGVQFGRGR